MEAKEFTLQEVENLEKDIAELLKKYWLYEDYSYAVFMRHDWWKTKFWWIKIDVYDELD